VPDLTPEQREAFLAVFCAPATADLSPEEQVEVRNLVQEEKKWLDGVDGFRFRRTLAVSIPASFPRLRTLAAGLLQTKRKKLFRMAGGFTACCRLAESA
jgi:hypothetical protein